MQEISQDVLNHCVVFVDQLEAVLSESGEIIKAVGHNALKKKPSLRLVKWLLHKEMDYKRHSTVFKSVGLAIRI